MTYGPSKPPTTVKFQVQIESIQNVMNGLLAGDISNCKSPDVKHTAEFLAHVYILQNLAPGFLDGMMALAIPHFIDSHNKANLGEVAQRKANEAGFGDEWKSAIEAGKHPKQKDYVANMVAVFMKARGLNQNQAIKAVAAETGRDEDSMRRTVTRSKKRRRP